MYLSFAAQFAAVWMFQVSTPGPNFVRISHSALEHSRRAAFAVAMGTALGNLFWCIVVVAGAAVAANSGYFGTALRLGGGLYLLHLGYQFVVRALTPGGYATSTSSSSTGLSESLRSGLVTAMANPQTALFFATYLLIAGEGLGSMGIILVGGPIVVTTTLLWYGAVILILTNPASQRRYLACRRPLDAVFGCVIIYSGIRLFADLGI